MGTPAIRFVTGIIANTRGFDIGFRNPDSLIISTVAKRYRIDESTLWIYRKTVMRVMRLSKWIAGEHRFSEERTASPRANGI